MNADARPRLLIVDDDPLIVDTLGYLLASDFSLMTAHNRVEAITTIRQTGGELALALVDLGLPPWQNRPDEGLALIGELLAHDPQCKIIVLSGQNEEAHARHARTLGALEFIAKPAHPQLLRDALLRALRVRQDELDNQARSAATERIVGRSEIIERTREQLQKFALSSFPVLIEGESGAGKEVAAQALHELAHDRRSKRFIALNCAAIAPGLIEATLFGHARGAFTGAQTAQAGYFEEAADGTLFLDEIGELPLELQPKLLRVLESGDYQRVGETQKRQAHARVIAATNRDLQQEVRAGRFRADLFHRLSVLKLRMPALREMGNDRALMLDHYCRLFSAQLACATFRLDVEAMQCWMHYDFPGNVRELRNIIIRLLVHHAGQIVTRAMLEAELEPDITSTPEPTHTASPTSMPPSAEIAGGVDLAAVLRRVEHDYIVAALREARGNMSQAARLLGINRSTLYNRMETLARHGEDFGDQLPGQ